MKKLGLLLIWLLCLETAGADLAAAWQEPEATFRLELNGEPGVINYLPLGNMALPTDLKNSISLVDEQGESLTSHLDRDSGDLFYVLPESFSRAYLYFDFGEARAFPTWPVEKYGRIPAREALTVTTVPAVLRGKPAKARRDHEEKALAELRKSHDRLLIAQNLTLENLKSALRKKETESLARRVQLDGEQAKLERQTVELTQTLAAREQTRNWLKVEAETFPVRTIRADLHFCGFEPVRLKLETMLAGLQEEIAKLEAQQRDIGRRLTLTRREVEKERKLDLDPDQEQLRQAERRYARECEIRDQALEKLHRKFRQERRQRRREIEPFFVSPKTVFGVGKAAAVRITGNPFGAKQNYAARITGKLRITRPGIYEFAINSIDSSSLLIGEHLVVAWPDLHEKGEEPGKTGEIELDAGWHDLEFYYQKSRGESDAVAAWRGPDEEEFRELVGADFLQPARAEVSSCLDRAGDRYPLVFHELKGDLFVDGKTYLWYGCELRRPEDGQGFEWTINGNKILSAPKMDFLLEQAGAQPLGLNSSRPDFRSLPFTLPEPDKKYEKENRNPDLFLKLWTPTFIDDDEQLEMAVEVRSELSREVNALLTVSTSKTVTGIEAGVNYLELEGKPDTGEKSFLPAPYTRINFPLAGSEVKDGFYLTFTLTIPPLTVAKRSLLFVPLAKGRRLRETDGGLADAQDRLVVPVLHRPTLAEIRTWSFARNIIDHLQPARKLLVIGDDFGPAPHSFVERFKEKIAGAGVEFLAWKTASAGIAIRASFAEWHDYLGSTQAEVAVLIPPAQATRDGVGIRLQQRLLAAIIQDLKANDNIRKLIILTPFPSLLYAGPAEEMARAVQNLAREYGIELLDIHSHIKARTNWREAYRPDPQAPGLVTDFPVRYVDLISEHLTEAVK